VAHVVYYVAMSLDGRIAGPGDALDFLETLDRPEDYGDAAFDPFFENVDALVMGATTFRVILEAMAGGTLEAWPYGDRPSWIMTRGIRDVSLPGASVRACRTDPRAAVAQMAAEGHRLIWLVGGGAVAASFLADDLVDEIVVTLAPTIIGSGPTLADGDHLPLRRFTLTDVVQGPNSVALRYRRDR
jgi:riboflavin biosynthesis pyrimidine reductase